MGQSSNSGQVQRTISFGLLWSFLKIQAENYKYELYYGVVVNIPLLAG